MARYLSSLRDFCRLVLHRGFLLWSRLLSVLSLMFSIVVQIISSLKCFLQQKQDVDMAGFISRSNRCFFSRLPWDHINFINNIKFGYIVKEIGKRSNKIITVQKLTLLSLRFPSCDVSVRSGSSSSDEYDLDEPFALFFPLSKRGFGEKAQPVYKRVTHDTLTYYEYSYTYRTRH